MFDIILDTNVLSDFIASFYNCDVRNNGNFEAHNSLTAGLANRINGILNNYRSYEALDKGVIVASSFAFVEIARQFEKISNGRFSRVQFKAFIDSPPAWFVIESMNNELFPFLQELPSSVVMPGGTSVPIEWADAIHVATALARNNTCLIAVTDKRIANIPSINNRIFK